MNDDFLAGGGEMAALVRARDWSGTAIGPIAAWPSALRVSLATCLASPLPALLWWGQKRTLFYNDACRRLLGPLHPFALGAEGSPGLPEEIAEAVEQVARHGEAIVLQNLPAADGRCLSFSLSPIRDETGIAGIFCPVLETAEQMLAIERSEERFRALVNASSDVIYQMSADWSEMRHLDGRNFIPDTPDPSRTWLQKYIPKDEQPRVTQRIAEAIADRTTFELEHRVLRVDGSIGWTFSRAVPLLDKDGEIAEWFGAGSDITPRKMTEQALREREAQFRLIVESAADFAIFTTDLNGRITTWNSGAQRILGHEADEVLGSPVALVFIPEERESRPDWEMQTALAEGSAESEGWRVRRDGSRFWASGLMMPLKNEAGRVHGFLKIIRDRTEKRQEEEQRKLLLDELNHRVKNTLATVQSVAMQTMRSTPSPQEFQEVFGSRLMALSQAHDLLTRRNWQGADLGDVVSQTLSPYRHRESRLVEISGPPLELRPNTAVMLNLIVHEMATNAAKYGALSAPEGRVSVAWEIHQRGCGRDGGDRWAEIRWTETGGPPVAAPRRKGFGTRLVERSVTQELEGEVDFNFAPEGVRCIICLPFNGNMVPHD